MRYHTNLGTRLGELTVVREEGALTGLYFRGHWPRPDRTAFGLRTEEGFEDVARQLDEYLAGDRSVFELPVKVRGAEFDRRVWELVSGVPYGQTTTYGDLARRLGAGTDPRDVGAAVGRNPLCIVIPCHRVIGSSGKLTGYAGGLNRKRALLGIEHERVRRTGRALLLAAPHGRVPAPVYRVRAPKGGATTDDERGNDPCRSSRTRLL
jgi:methylated-DNA-[protein]-cysteine S-methyltransferase